MKDLVQMFSGREVRYVIRFVFHVLRLPPVRFAQPNFVLRERMYNEASVETGLRIGLPFI